MMEQNILIPSDMIQEKNMTLEEIGRLLEGFNFQNSSYDRGDVSSGRSKRWNSCDPEMDYWLTKDPSNTALVFSCVSVASIMIGCFLALLGFKYMKWGKRIEPNEAKYERAKILN